MSDWPEEGNKHWPVKYPVKGPAQRSQRRFGGTTPLRWTGMARVDARELQKRLLWLLLTLEIGMALAAGCLLPLVFLKLPIREEGVVGPIPTELGHLLGLSGELTCLLLVLPISILLLTLGFGLGRSR